MRAGAVQVHAACLHAACGGAAHVVRGYTERMHRPRMPPARRRGRTAAGPWSTSRQRGA